jgi:hypothetical protein
MKIALTMISKGKGEEEQLKRALSSITPYVDAVYITLTAPRNLLDNAEEVITSFARPDMPVHISYGDFLWTADQGTVDWVKNFLGYEPHMKVGDKIFQFDEARNYNLSQVPQDQYPWILWIDSDDVFRNGQELKRVAKLAEDNNVEAVYFNYLYQCEFDEKGNITAKIIEHLRERLVRNNGAFKWVSPIHETLIEQRPSQKTDDPSCDVVHYATMASRMDSLTRNLKNLELAIYRTKGEDPRHTYYLAKAYFDMNKPDYNERTIPLIEQYLAGDHKSGWPEERAQACEYLCEIYRRQGKHSEALKAALRGLEEPCEPPPSIYVNLALCWVMLQHWELAMYWVRLATQMPDQKTTLVRNTKDIQGRVLEIIYNAQLNLHKIDEAWAASKKMLELYPNEQTVSNAYQFIEQMRTQRDLVLEVQKLANFLTRSGEVYKIKPLLAAVPAIIEQTPFVQEMYMKNNPPTAWADNEIAIFCGPGFTDWGPSKLKDPGGAFVGGSEEAVINMSRELVKQGWKVTVYADPGTDEGVIDGVKWLPYYKFNQLDNFNIIIVWRQLGFFDTNFKAKKAYLWLHDLPNKLEYNEERLKKITKVIPLSKFHRDQIDTVPDEKIFISTNGI